MIEMMGKPPLYHIVFTEEFNRVFSSVAEGDRLLMLSVITDLESDPIPGNAVSVGDILPDAYVISWRKYYITYVFPYVEGWQKVAAPPIIAVCKLREKMPEIDVDDNIVRRAIRWIATVWNGFFVRHN